MTSAPFFFSPSSPGDAVVPPTPLAFWPINEGSGAVVNDSIGSIDLAIDTATWVATGRNSTNCLNFDAYTEWCWVADPFYLDTMTLCFWFNPATIGSSRALIVKRNNNTHTTNPELNEWQCSLTSSNTLAFLKWDGVNATAILNLQSTSTMTQNEWNHFAVTSEGGVNGKSRIFLNGSFSVEGTQTIAMGDTASVLQFGGRTAASTSNFFNGRLQEVRIYNSVLTDEQVAAVYALPPP